MRRLSWMWLVLVLASCTPPGDQGTDTDLIFVSDRVPRWNLEIEAPAWVKLIEEPDVFVSATLEVDGEKLGEVGLRILGNADEQKPSFRVKFNEFDPELRFHGVKRINLHNQDGDTSLVREMAGLWLMRRAKVPAPLSSFVHLTTNRGPVGVYTLVEQVDKKFLERVFQEDSGNLYKGERGAALAYVDDEPSSYPEALYEKKTNETDPDRSDLIELIRVLNQTPDAELPRALGRILDVPGVLRWLAVNTWLAHFDSYAGKVDNYFLYHGADGRFRFIPWGLARSFGNYHGVACMGSVEPVCQAAWTVDDYLILEPVQVQCLCGVQARPLIDRLMQNGELRAQYQGVVDELAQGALSAQAIKDEVERLHDFIAPFAHEDTMRECYTPPCEPATFDRSLDSDDPAGALPDRVPGLVPFVEARQAAFSR